jgi:hypothetical protein
MNRHYLGGFEVHASTHQLAESGVILRNMKTGLLPIARPKSNKILNWTAKPGMWSVYMQEHMVILEHESFSLLRESCNQESRIIMKSALQEVGFFDRERYDINWSVNQQNHTLCQKPIIYYPHITSGWFTNGVGIWFDSVPIECRMMTYLPAKYEELRFDFRFTF